MINKAILMIIGLNFFSFMALPLISATPSAETKLSIYPPVITVVAENTFIIDVNIVNVKFLAGVLFKLGWNASIINLLKIELFPPWRNSFVAINETGVDPETGLDYWEVGVGSLAGAIPFSGNATLARLTYKAITWGNSTLDLNGTRLSDYETNPISHDVFDGYVEVTKILGDINYDGQVDIFDVIVWANAFGSQPNDPNWNPQADLYPDNFIDIFDGIIISQNYGKTYHNKHKPITHFLYIYSLFMVKKEVFEWIRTGQKTTKPFLPALCLLFLLLLYFKNSNKYG